jgi:hypothetical protein
MTVGRLLLGFGVLVVGIFSLIALRVAQAALFALLARKPVAYEKHPWGLFWVMLIVGIVGLLKAWSLIEDMHLQ